MSDLNQQLIDAAGYGDLAGVRAALAAGADIHTESDFPLQSATRAGHLEIVEFLITAGAEVNADDSLALRWAAEVGHLAIVHCLFGAGATVDAGYGAALYAAAEGGHADVVRVILAHEPSLKPISDEIQTFSAAVQVAAMALGHLGLMDIDDWARQGVCPEALCALLERQGRCEIATLISATQMLEPLTPAERAAVLSGLIPKKTRREATHVGPR